MADDRAYPDPGRIATQADFGDELTVLRQLAGLRIRDVARASGVPVSTTGDYFSGRHLPADVQQLVRILEACGETDLTRIERWQAALQRARRSPGRRTDTPYRGLARFETRDARWFFGREDVTEQLVSLAAQASALPLMLVGPSGAGKSSVLRAGLMPRLRELAGTAPDGPTSISGSADACAARETSCSVTSSRPKNQRASRVSNLARPRYGVSVLLPGDRRARCSAACHRSIRARSVSPHASSIRASCWGSAGRWRPEK